MKKLIVVLIALLVLPSITLAAKGGSKPPDVNYEALIAEEAAAREAADITLQNNINSEAATREANDAALQDMIDIEAQSRIEDDAVMADNIATGKAAMYAGDEALQDQIDNIELTPQGTLNLTVNFYEPYPCDADHIGDIALTSYFTTCVCDKFDWVSTSDGITDCYWGDPICDSSHLELCIEEGECTGRRAFFPAMTTAIMPLPAAAIAKEITSTPVTMLPASFAITIATIPAAVASMTGSKTPTAIKTISDVRSRLSFNRFIYACPQRTECAKKRNTSTCILEKTVYSALP